MGKSNAYLKPKVARELVHSLDSSSITAIFTLSYRCIGTINARQIDYIERSGRETQKWV